VAGGMGSLRACGARPSATGPTPTRVAQRESPEMTPKAIFSEGRTLCVRIARPCACPYVPLPEVTRRVARGLMGTCPGQVFAIFTGVQSPPLRHGANPNVGRLAGHPGDDAKGDLLGGTHSVRPRCKAALKPRDHIIIGGKERPVA